MLYSIFPTSLPKTMPFYEIKRKIRYSHILLRRKDAIFFPDGSGKNTGTLSGYLIPTAFLRQQWISECASLLRHTYIACLVRTCGWVGIKCHITHILLIVVVIL